MKKIKIYGAGSIGNHMAHASRSLGWQVDLCDIDPKALERTEKEIYPGRYGKWDEAIKLHSVGDVPKGDYDLIIIGTPPDHHLDIALEVLDERPKALLIEKPLCTPDLAAAEPFFDKLKELGVRAFIGYDHVVAKATRQIENWLDEKRVGEIQTIDVEFREHWGGIFKAHPWLSGPKDTYLGFWKRGGGALGEHSHALNLWMHFARHAKLGGVSEVAALIDYVEKDGASYDRLASLHLSTESGITGITGITEIKGRVVQDVVTRPTRKWARIQGESGALEWIAGFRPGCDAAVFESPDGKRETLEFEKTRPDDFIEELKTIESALESSEATGIDIERGLDTMTVIGAAHESARERRSFKLNSKAGYSPAAWS